ncbi:hypothetical protein LRS74_24895 [Streptomyces sp. LX-29]|uniref:hypothetical protein n=1 Tax=Streptomyces sp. LX-29 TaxID=2900152 RepID=UPI00240D076E|nr:hypothetical protein [Streptomyces sp. LX-29]WFB09914.1 hypothetical protein LRS74_24895 [Streptomyces sp. LX-29]
MGYVWLVTAWLAIHDRIPSQKAASGFFGDLYDLSDAVGRPASLAAMSVVAYLLGAMTEMGAGTALKIVNHVPGIEVKWASEPALDDLRDHVREKVNAKRQGLEGPQAQAEAESLMQQITAERDQLVVRLRHSTRVRYEEVSRTTAEADFRVSIGIALLGTVIVIGLQYEAFALFLLVLPSWLIMRGCLRYQQSNDELVQGVVLSETSSGAIERFMRS